MSHAEPVIRLVFHPYYLARNLRFYFLAFGRESLCISPNQLVYLLVSLKDNLITIAEFNSGFWKKGGNGCMIIGNKDFRIAIDAPERSTHFKFNIGMHRFRLATSDH